MNASPDDRLHRLLGGEHLAPLRQRLRRRFELAATDGPLSQLRMNDLADEERAALARLVGRPPSSTRSMQLDLTVADDNLRRSGVASSLRDALERLDGPIVHRATARLHREALWSAVVDGCTHPTLVGLLATPEGASLLKLLARKDSVVAGGLCRSAEAVLQRLPGGAIVRSQLAADVLGDAHALDNGQPVATLVLAAWRRRTHSVPGSEDGSLLGNAERARDTWAAAGILVNQLARPALFLNLPVKSAADDGRTGEPSYLSLRSLLRSPPAWDVAEKRIFVCENPNLVAIAADRSGRDCAPLVCTDGMPAAAQRALLSQLALSGARLCYHGDFDWPGLRIANHVMREYGAGPWRFNSTDYVAAVRTIPDFAKRLEGTPVNASWDEGLVAAMTEHGVAVAEEAVATQLVADLTHH